MIDRTPLIEWCMVGCESERAPKKTYVNMRCEWMLKICQPLQGAIVNTIEAIYIPIMTYNLNIQIP